MLMMLLMSFGAMLTFPFASFFAMTRSHVNQEGKYMSLFTISYSIAHILGAKTSLTVIENYSYNSNWIFMITIGLLAVLLSYWLNNLIHKENEEIISKITHSLFKSK